MKIETSKGSITLHDPDALLSMTPQAMTEYLQQVEQAKQALEIDLSLSQSKLEASREKLEGIKAEAKQKFGTDDMAQLATVRDGLLDKIRAALSSAPQPAQAENTEEVAL